MKTSTYIFWHISTRSSCTKVSYRIDLSGTPCMLCPGRFILVESVNDEEQFKVGWNTICLNALHLSRWGKMSTLRLHHIWLMGCFQDPVVQSFPIVRLECIKRKKESTKILQIQAKIYTVLTLLIVASKKSFIPKLAQKRKGPKSLSLLE